jgi:Tol biopolymer transport system component
MHDRQTGATERVSIDSNGQEGDNGSEGGSLSSDGRFVGFYSLATNLVARDTNAAWDVFVHDRVSGSTERVSVDSSGNEADLSSYSSMISADGRYVAFYSWASNLCSGDTNQRMDAFVHDRTTGTTECVSVDSSGIPGDGESRLTSISSDGTLVCFVSLSTNLVYGDTNGDWDVFVRDCTSGRTELESVSSSGVQRVATHPPTISAALSPDGRYVAFGTDSDNLVPHATNGAYDDFLHDRQTGTTERVSVD